jgi:hypothetical protein
MHQYATYMHGDFFGNTLLYLQKVNLDDNDKA